MIRQINTLHPFYMSLLLLLTLVSSTALTQNKIDGAKTIERNVVYGMYSGLALLVDVYYPEKSNGKGIIFIAGSGFHAPMTYTARQLKETWSANFHLPPLLKEGYTVFAINHRAAPRFRYPAAVEDAQRAVRFIRYHAKKYGIDPDYIGGIGESSGGLLIMLLGTMEGKGDTEDPDSVNQVSSRIQAMTTFCSWGDLTSSAGNYVNMNAVGSYMGMRLFPINKESKEYKIHKEASPIFHVTSDDAPLLLVNVIGDSVVSILDAERMQVVMNEAGVPSKLLRVPGNQHGIYDKKPEYPDFHSEMVIWFNRYLSGK